MLTILHALAYQRLEKRRVPYEAALWGVSAVMQSSKLRLVTNQTE